MKLSKERFRDYLLEIGKSEKTTSNYEQAVASSMSKWVKEHKIFSEPLDSISSVSEFDRVAIQLRRLEIFSERNLKGKGMYQAALNAFRAFLMGNEDIAVVDDLQEIIEDPAVPETEKHHLVKSRIGQGKFRGDVLNHWGNSCAVTGYQEATFLVASHIKPWKASTNEERLNPYNGLMLIPNLDKAFDKGFITFADDGQIKVSHTLGQASLLGIQSSMHIELKDKHRPFLSFHQEHVFQN
tara:strand:+ start:16117 stop:16836 length:720 start_codon:yes stop_codon:yes gene_type:complete